jgi:hypothetical protein
MPYKSPERKRQWEQEHREQRDAQRKKRRLDVKGVPVIPQRPTPIVANETKSCWKMILGLALGFGLLVLGAGSGIRTPVRK